MNLSLYPARNTGFAVVAVLLVAGNQKLNASDWKDRFLSDGISCLRESQKLSFWLQATMHEEQVSPSGTTFAIHECYFQGNWRLNSVKSEFDWEQVPESKRERIPVEVVRGANSRYEFRLYRTRKGPFRVGSIEPIGAEPREVGPETIRNVGSLCAGWMLHRHPVPDWLKKDGFRLETIEPTNSPDGRTLVRVKAKFTAPEQKKEMLYDDGSFDADVLLDPENHWCICSANYVSYLKGEWGAYRVPEHVNIEYGPSVEGMPVPRLVTNVIEWPREATGTAATVTTKYVISDVKKTGDVKESEFMLRRFGLPEVKFVGMSPGPQKSYLWLWCFGFATAVIFVLIVWGLLGWRKHVPA